MAQFMGDHIPHRPSWQCVDEPGVPWPCVVFKRRIWLQFPDNPDGLIAHMGTWMVAANEELPELSPDELIMRFVGWIDLWPGQERKRDGVRGNAGHWDSDNGSDADRFRGDPGE
jgi:hypothetical protein